MSVNQMRIVSLLALAGAAGGAYLLFPGIRSEVQLVANTLARGDVEGLRDYILSYGVWAPIISALIMILQAVFAPLPAFVITFANGLAFGALQGGLLSLVSAAIGGSICFWISRILGRRPVEIFVGRSGLEAADAWFEHRGAYAVLVARLIPIVSFDAVSYAAGLTRMGFRGYLLATVVGMSPATFVYSYLGEHAPRHVELLLVVFGLVIAASILTAALRRRRSRKPGGTPP
ncbi:TVP38/TMEM64 family protein [Rubrobacter taiwanensis]|uniref:TVP38/TMEM64 family membrane protein n=1 Tax=Rubrobacter taiwanensis TaxID=185139 RepID=A0A4R1BI43_9ACTN|nr:TVP38/TMEM64 family protein [Rubrobacter taiwanensis]TCJ16867.1 TVP38/TMEM64 family protein [Rubrobacter taiwanensis]